MRALAPDADLRRARYALRVTSEAKNFVEKVRTPPFGGVSDVRDELKRAAIGLVLDAASLLSIGRFAAGSRLLRETIFGVSQELKPEFVALFEIAEGIFPRKDVEKAVFEAVDDDGQIRDDASLELLRARRNMRVAQGQIQTRLRAMLADSRVTAHLQDTFITVRDGRYCLPVKAESRGSVPGIVHDRSSSGNAVFVEPQAVVELNNRLRELQNDEKEAIEAILRAVSELCGGASDELLRSCQAAGELDFAFAKAHLSHAQKALAPTLRDDVHGWNLIRARHPLVEGCVPNDLKLGDESAVTERGDFDVMMLTGPNTGGKTIVLKTLGLLSAMAACGLHIPVEETSWLSLPGQIHVDIGDEQSIEQSLSTFSGHLKNIVEILETVRPNDLVLFDEIGAGTDPDEGAALAKAVLRSLHRKGAKVVATTHYGELKQFALSAQRFENASVEFDAKTLRPTYHLRIGVPGASNALEIAARLGMPGEIIGRARKYLGSDHIEAEAAAQRLDETARELNAQAQEVRAQKREIERLQREYEARIARVESENKRELARARREAKEIVERAQNEADAALKELRRAAKSGQGSENKGTEEARNRLKTLRERVKNGDETATEKLAEILSAKARDEKSPFAETVLSAQDFKIGDMALVKSLDKEGEILKIEGEKLEIRVGAMKISLRPSDLSKPRKRALVSGVAGIQSRKSWGVPTELNLIGYTTEEALEELEKYLDDAVLAALPSVRIVHGRGSGALRGLVQSFLRTFRAAKSFEFAPQNEGGDGATVVTLG